jgi:hypothetical protein
MDSSTEVNTTHGRRSFMKKAVGTSGLLGAAIVGTAGVASAGGDRTMVLEPNFYNDLAVTYYFEVSSSDLSKASAADGSDNVNRRSNFSSASGTVSYPNKDSYSFGGDIRYLSAEAEAFDSNSAPYLAVNMNGDFDSTNRNNIKFACNNEGNGSISYAFNPTGSTSRTGSLESSDDNLGDGGGGFVSAGYQDRWVKSGQLSYIRLDTASTRGRVYHY